MEHVLKIWPCYFEPVAAGIKTFEYRIYDRDYEVGDTLRLREYDPETDHYSGRECLVRVTYIFRVWDRHNQHYCIMSIIRELPGSQPTSHRNPAQNGHLLNTNHLIFLQMKQLTIIGNLGSNAVRRTASDGKELMTFNVAVNAGTNQTIWFNCIGNFREKIFEYLVKGQCVGVIGDLSARVYNGNLDLGVNIDRVELCGRAPETKTDSANTSSQPSATPADPSSQPITQQQPINPLQ